MVSAISVSSRSRLIDRRRHHVLLQVRHRGDRGRRQQVDRVGDAGEVLDGVQDEARRGVHERRVRAGHDRAVARARSAAPQKTPSLPLPVSRARLAAPAAGCTTARSSRRRRPAPPSAARSAARCRRCTNPMSVLAGAAEVAADDLLPRRLLHRLVVDDAEPGPVHAHVRGRLVGRATRGSARGSAAGPGKISTSRL